MGKYKKLIQRILSGRRDTSVHFTDVVALLQALGFSLRIKGSHHIFDREGVEELINIQSDGSKAKAYQVKQIRDLIVKYRLEVKDE